MMYSTAYRIIGNHDDTKDVLQEAFLKVFKNIDSFRQECPLAGWIKTIVVRESIGKLRKEKRFDDLEEGQFDQIVAPVNLFDGAYLEKVILSLPPRCRSVFLLIEVEGFSHKETAKLLEISEGTSKSQLHRSKEILQKKLASMYELIYEK